MADSSENQAPGPSDCDPVEAFRRAARLVRERHADLMTCRERSLSALAEERRAESEFRNAEASLEAARNVLASAPASPTAAAPVDRPALSPAPKPKRTIRERFPW